MSLIPSLSYFRFPNVRKLYPGEIDINSSTGEFTYTARRRAGLLFSTPIRLRVENEPDTRTKQFKLEVESLFGWTYSQLATPLAPFTVYDRTDGRGEIRDNLGYENDVTKSRTSERPRVRKSPAARFFGCSDKIVKRVTITHPNDSRYMSRVFEAMDLVLTDPAFRREIGRIISNGRIRKEQLGVAMWNYLESLAGEKAESE